MNPVVTGAAAFNAAASANRRNDCFGTGECEPLVWFYCAGVAIGGSILLYVFVSLILDMWRERRRTRL